jgi:DNA topoisomerase-3
MPPGSRGAIGIGRVKTPTLSIVCRRELEIQNFKPVDYYEVDVDVSAEAGDLALTCAKLPRELAGAAAADDPEADGEDEDERTEDDAAFDKLDNAAGKILQKPLAERLAAAARAWRGPVSCETKTCRQAPPKIHDLTSLQAACSARFGWSGDKTLEVAQKLYAEHQIITYPRAEGRHLGETQIPEAKPLAASLTALPDYAEHRDLVAEPVIRKGKSGLFSDKSLEGSSHHGIAPNFNTRERFAEIVPQLSADETRLWDIVARSYLAALAPDYVYRQTQVTALIPCDVPVKTESGVQEKSYNWTFRASGRIPLDFGWRAITGAPQAKTKKPGETDDETELPALRNGEAVTATDSRVRAKQTKPPVRYTDGTLLKMMKEAWRFVSDPALRAKLKEHEGIGTPATRGGIVEGLFRQGQIARQKKQIVPTAAGLKLYQLLLQVAPELTDPARTAAWETLFSQVEAGRMTFMEAVDRLAEQARRSIEGIKAAREKGAVSIDMGKAAPPSPKMLKYAEMIADRKGVKLPAKARRDASICRSFLDEHAPKADEQGKRGALPPSQKQKDLARRIAQTKGVELDPAILEDGARLKKWLDAQVEQGVPPSPKQLSLAQGLARDGGLEIPETALSNARDLSRWIDANKDKVVRPPSEKQIALARKLADEKGGVLPQDAALDAKKCSAFIDAHMSRGGRSGSKGGGKGGASKSGARAGAGQGAPRRRGA